MRRQITPAQHHVPKQRTPNYYERSRIPEQAGGPVAFREADTALQAEDATRLQKFGAAAAALALAVGLNVFAAPAETHAQHPIAAAQETGDL